ncbi:2OG-Fe(II) oxygenase [Gemmata sp. JC673]|uniref:2OG-Fe(II) oxygenase n=1 Tax=Gemmata algarum TaxID=2975278 RepID=A0ABU5F6F7_9BACT|nr:2OG-Fe(II) oxygenase [Gemmata algarum]MDY3562936.1 2OG-Fe(II) oxygenase [Gemmata algarum]
MPEMRKEFLAERDDLFVIHDFFSPDECDYYITMTESAGYGDAPITTTGGPVMRKDIRNNDRVMIDDAGIAQSVWERLRPFVPDRVQFWQPVGLNERWRFYRYDPGQQFDWHFDGAYERSPIERSAFTLMIYLNGGVAGGATEFNLRSHGGTRSDDPIVRVQPEAGKVLVFPHRIYHRGAPVADGRKYVMRSDIMCRWLGGE